jgi:hypothetical protein
LDIPDRVRQHMLTDPFCASDRRTDAPAAAGSGQPPPTFLPTLQWLGRRGTCTTRVCAAGTGIEAARCTAELPMCRIRSDAAVQEYAIRTVLQITTDIRGARVRPRGGAGRDHQRFERAGAQKGYRGKPEEGYDERGRTVVMFRLESFEPSEMQRIWRGRPNGRSVTWAVHLRRTSITSVISSKHPRQAVPRPTSSCSSTRCSWHALGSGPPPRNPRTPASRRPALPARTGRSTSWPPC